MFTISQHGVRVPPCMEGEAFLNDGGKIKISGDQVISKAEVFNASGELTFTIVNAVFDNTNLDIEP